MRMSALLTLAALMLGGSAGGRTLLVLTEPTARGYIGNSLDAWVAQVLREGTFTNVQIREGPRMVGVTGSLATRWAGINWMSNVIESMAPDAVQIIGALPRHVGGSHAADGHYTRKAVGDAPLQFFPRAFSDSSTSFSSATSILATNVPGDGFHDAWTGYPTNFARPVARIDFSGIGAKSGTWSGGCLDAQSKLPAVDEATAFASYFTTNLWYRRKGYVIPATGKLTGLYSWTDGLRVSNLNNSVTWAYASPTTLGGTTNRIVYSSWWYDERDDMIAAGDCSPTRCLLHIVYKSYGFEDASVANGNSELVRWMAWGHSLSSAWSASSVLGASFPFWRTGASDVVLADVIETSLDNYGSWDEFYNLLGDLTLPMGAITQDPPGEGTAITATVSTVTGP